MNTNLIQQDVENYCNWKLLKNIKKNTKICTNQTPILIKMMMNLTQFLSKFIIKTKMYAPVQNMSKTN